MVEANRSPIEPERVFARRYVERHQLAPPVDVEALLRGVATVKRESFPGNWDAVVLRREGKIPEVVISPTPRSTRIRFTLAHELGHILLPWQFGSAFCHPDVIPHVSGGPAYEQNEYEANRFASELLLPHAWLKTRWAAHPEQKAADAIMALAVFAGVSPITASLAVGLACGFPLITWVEARDGSIAYPSKSSPCIVRNGIAWRENPRAVVKHGGELSVASFGQSQLCAIHLPVRHAPSTTKKSKRGRPLASSSDLLDEIIGSTCKVPQEQATLRQRVNGVAGYANKLSIETGRDDLLWILQAQFANRPDLSGVTLHRLFGKFLEAKARELAANRKS